MPPTAKSRFWGRARVTFRWLRITGWLLILAVICALLWANRVGLPDFLTQRLVAALREKGVEAEFSRMRLRYHGIVAEQVRFSPAAQTNGFSLAGQELTLRLDYTALWHRQLGLRGVALSDGSMRVPLLASNLPPRTLAVDRLQAQLDFLSDERWQLSMFDGHCLGIDFHFSGTVSNTASLLKLKGGDEAAARRRDESLNRAVAQLEKLRFPAGARMKGYFSADAETLETRFAQLEMTAAQFASPWGDGRKLALMGSIQSVSNALSRVELDVSARGAQTPWGRAATLHLKAHASLPHPAAQLRDGRLDLDAANVQTEWAGAGSLRLVLEAAAPSALGWAKQSAVELKAQTVRSAWGTVEELDLHGTLAANPTNAALASGSYELLGQRLRSRWLDTSNVWLTAQTVQLSSNLWPTSVVASVELQQPVAKSTNASAGWRGQAKTARLEGTFALPAASVLAWGDTNITWSARWEKIPAAIRADLRDLQAGRFEAGKLAADVKWREPSLQIDSLAAQLYGGQLNATGRLDMVTRELSARLSTDMDPHQLAPFFVTNASEWKAWAQFEQPPRWQAGLRVLLPAWTNPAPDWRGEILPTLTVAGEVAAGAGAVRSVSFTSLRSGFALTNLSWQLRDLIVTRAGEQLRLDLASDGRTRDFRAQLDSSINPAALRPLLDSEAAQRALGYFEFTEPPRLDLEIGGRWNDWDCFRLRGHARLTNLTFRGEAVKSCITDVAFTNQVLDCSRVRLERAEGAVTADHLRVDLAKEALFLTNVQSGIEVLSVARAIGPHVVKVLAPYQFGLPPTVHLEGAIGLRDRSGWDDARFEVAGGPFQWRNFKFTNLTTRVHWLRDTLTLTNFAGALHGGEVKGSAFFAFPPGRQGTDFRFDVAATNLNARTLLADLFPASTNLLEGTLSGQLVITNGNDLDLKHWDGFGDVTLRDGLIWDVPVFKLFSPMLNKVVPGLGNSRARRASANFAITNSVILTSDLEVHASGMRMQFDGTVDFEGTVLGTMEAELLRDTPGFGWMISRVFWPVTKIFEYKVSGTLGNPKTKPLFIPKILMAPLHPLRTLEELFGEDKNDAPPPAPPK